LVLDTLASWNAICSSALHKCVRNRTHALDNKGEYQKKSKF